MKILVMLMNRWEHLKNITMTLIKESTHLGIKSLENYLVISSYQSVTTLPKSCLNTWTVNRTIWMVERMPLDPI